MPIELIEVDLTECNHHDLCNICNHVDELSCSRGRHCAGLRLDGRPAMIGYFMDEDDRGTSAYTFKFEGTDEFLFCEDCAIDIRDNSDGVTDPILEGQVDELVWVVDIADSRFQAYVATYGPDHGLQWEDERGTFDTLPEAVMAARDHAVAMIAERNAAVDREEFELENHEVLTVLRKAGRLKHPTSLAVETSLTRAQLDHVVFGGSGEEPPVTVRELLASECYHRTAEMVADMLEGGRIPPA